MIQDYIAKFLGIIRIYIYKLLYFKKIKMAAIPKINHNFKIAIKGKSRLILGRNFSGRNNIVFRIYDGGSVEIGNNCFLNDNCSINCQKSIKIGNGFLCGQNVIIIDHDHDYKNNRKKFIKDDIVIGNNVWIGANCVILKGAHIGNNVVIAAGTVVKDEIGDNLLVYQERINKYKKYKNPDIHR